MFYRLRRIRKLFQLKFHVEYLYEHTLSVIPEEKADLHVVVEKLTSEGVGELRSVWNVDLLQAQKRLERGDICFMAMLQGKPASYHWVQYQGIHFIQQIHRHVPVTAGEGWIYHVRVADWARGNRINSLMYAAILRDARERGKSKLLVYTASSNIANQKGLLKCGFRLTEKFYSINWGGRYFLLYTRKVRS